MKNWTTHANHSTSNVMKSFCDRAEFDALAGQTHTFSLSVTNFFTVVFFAKLASW